MARTRGACPDFQFVTEVLESEKDSFTIDRRTTPTESKTPPGSICPIRLPGAHTCQRQKHSRRFHVAETKTPSAAALELPRAPTKPCRQSIAYEAAACRSVDARRPSAKGKLQQA